MNTFNQFLLCPADCITDVVLPAIEADQDCPIAADVIAQVSDLVLFPKGVATPVDLSDAAAMATVIDNTIGDGTKATHLVGIGGVAEPEALTRPKPKGRIKRVRNTYTLTFVDEYVSDAKYEFCRKLQCSAFRGKIAYANAGHIYGAIVPKQVDVTMPLSNGPDDVVAATFKIIWDADGDPPRVATPF